MNTNKKQHWEAVYTSKSPQAVSWYQPHAETSLRLIRETGVAKSGAILDVGGGASTFVDDLLNEGYEQVTVLDLSAEALRASQARLGSRAHLVSWIEADITTVQLPENAYDVWHDRAVFHFLLEPEHRRAYVRAVQRSVKAGGHVIVATFAEDGPEKCSGLTVHRYSAEELHDEFGNSFALVHHEKEPHETPFGSIQNFVYCHCRVQKGEEFVKPNSNPLEP